MPARRLRPVPDAPRRAAIYVRVSSLHGREGERFHSPDVQAGQVRERLGQLGIAEVLTVEDLDRTGRNLDRPGLQQILAAVDAGQVDCVAVHELSRLGRNTADTLGLIDRLRRQGCSIVSTAEQVDDTPEGQLALTMWLAIAQHYSDQIGRRWRQLARRRTEELGQLHGSIPPIGYVRDGPHIKPDLALAGAVRVLFEGYAAGHAVGTLARAFSAARGRATAVASVKRALANPVYAGMVKLHGRTWPGAHEALVDDVTWQRVQRRLEADRRTPSRNLAEPSYSLVGLAVCDGCGYRVRRVTSGDQRAYLRCGRQVETHDCAGCGALAVHLAEAAVLAKVELRIARLRDESAERAALLARRSAGRADLTRIERELARDTAAQGRLTADRARRLISQAAYDAAAVELDARIGELEAMRTAAARQAEAPAPRAAISAARALLELWPQMTAGERNLALRALVSEVRVRPAGRLRQPAGERLDVVWL